MKFLSFFIGILVIITSIFIYQSQKNNQQTITGYVFGTYYVIKINTPEQNKELISEIDKIFQTVNMHLSIFEKNSELNKLNQANANIPIHVSAHLYKLLKASQNIYLQTDGYFDPSVSPLIELWGFGTNKEHKMPNKEKINQIRQIIGFSKISLQEPDLVIKKQKDLNLNLSAIAKGYAVDLVAQKLSELGYKDFLIDIGGEIFVAGYRNDKKEGWGIGIATPKEGEYKNSLAMELSNIALATSGNYRNFYYINGQKYAHTINPKTGYPVKHHLLSATVFHEKCMFADAYATAMMSMGEEKALQLANKYNIAAILIVADNKDSHQIIYSNQAMKMLGI